MTTFEAIPVVGVSGTPGVRSRSRALLDAALAALERYGTRTRRVDLAELPADALLGRRPDPAVTDALAAVQGARIIVVSTPTYRATYSGLLKVFFDLLPQDALAGKVAVAIATGAVPAHALAIDHGLRPLLASVGALVAATGVYGTDAQFPNGGGVPGPALVAAIGVYGTDAQFPNGGGVPEPALVERIERAAAEAATLAGLVPALET